MNSIIIVTDVILGVNFLAYALYVLLCGLYKCVVCIVISRNMKHLLQKV